MTTEVKKAFVQPLVNISAHTSVHSRDERQGGVLDWEPAGSVVRHEEKPDALRPKGRLPSKLLFELARLFLCESSAEADENEALRLSEDAWAIYRRARAVKRLEDAELSLEPLEPLEP